MSTLSLRCIKAALLYLTLGLVLGISFAANRALGVTLRPLHAEFNVWGWVTLLTYGFGYHMLPRFTGQPLHSQKLADLQSFLAISGVALAGLGWMAVAAHAPFAIQMCGIGAGIQLLAAILFVWQIGGLLRSRSA